MTYRTWQSRFASLLLVAAAVLSGCASTSNLPVPTGTDMWAAEPIEDVNEAKRISVAILTELAGLAPSEDLMPEESQSQAYPGEKSRRLISCSKPNLFQYPGMMGLRFQDGASAQAFESVVNEYMRQQEGWLEGTTPKGDGGTDPKFVSASGFIVSVNYREYKGRHSVSIYAFSPCFEMPDDFQQSVDEF